MPNTVNPVVSGGQVIIEVYSVPVTVKAIGLVSAETATIKAYFDNAVSEAIEEDGVESVLDADNNALNINGLGQYAIVLSSTAAPRKIVISGDHTVKA